VGSGQPGTPHGVNHRLSRHCPPPIARSARDINDSRMSVPLSATNAKIEAVMRAMATGRTRVLKPTSSTCGCRTVNCCAYLVPVRNPKERSRSEKKVIITRRENQVGGFGERRGSGVKAVQLRCNCQWTARVIVRVTE